MSVLDYVLIAVGLVAAYLALGWAFPGLLRPLWWVLVRVVYRFSVYGRERVPAAGGCLIVCNYVSLIDRLVLSAACPRTVTFVRWSGPDPTDEQVRKAAEALDAGRVVLIFPEGHLTRSGNMLPFGRGVERILGLTRADVPVIPACTEGLWGSVFSWHGGRIVWKLPTALRLRVAVMFGEPVSKYADEQGRAVPFFPSPRGGEGGERSEPGEGKVTQPGSPHPLTPDSSPPRGEGRRVIPAPELRLAVQEVMADCAIRRSDHVRLVHRAFVRHAVRFRNLFRTCVIDNSTGTARVLTWGRTFVGAVCLARYLRPVAGDPPNVGVWLPTGLGGVLANLAIAFLGKASVNLNYTAGTAPVRSAVRQAGIRVVVTAKRFTARIPLDLPDDVRVVYLEDVLESITRGQRVRTFLTALLLPGWFIDRFILGLHRHKVDDTLTIVFSSGSTGEPKGVVLTHRNVGSNADSAIRTIRILPGDLLFGVLPFFHSFGYTVCLWAPLVAGARALYFPDPRQAKEVGELARRHRPTLFLGTATFLRFYLRRCDKDDFRSLRILICGAEKLPVKLQDEFHAKFGVLPLEGYGCTELSPVVSTNLPDIEVGGLVQTRNARGTVGQPLFGVCMRAFTAEGREPLPTGREGVLCGKGPNVMAGYLHQPEKTKEAIRDGWYFTGDVGLIEPDGFIRITGRLSRFAKIAGEMIPLERLEEELHELFGGGERVLAVAAVPDERRGERLVVLYVAELEGRLGGLLDLLGTRGLPNLWVPDVRDCYVVEALPVLGSGKLDLKRVGELAKELARPG